MPTRVGCRTIEHWRDGECIARIEVTENMIQRNEDGTAGSCSRRGTSFWQRETSLHFDVDGLIDRLKGVK